MTKTTACLTSLVSLLVSPLARSGTPALPVEIDPPASPGDWEFELGLYGFIAGMDGTISAGTQKASFDYDISDILDNLDATFMAQGIATYGRFAFSADLLYLGLSGDGAPQGPLYEAASIEMDTLLATVSATYRLWERPGSFLEIGVGVRYLGMDTRVAVYDSNGNLPNIYEKASVDLWDGLGVVRIGHQFSPEWFFRFYGDVGGGDSHLTWQVFAGLGYAVTDHAVAVLGWRYLDYDLESGPVEADISISGPQLGLVFRF